MSISLNCLRNPFSTARAELGDGAVASRFLSDIIATMIRRGQRSRLSLSHRHRRISAFSIIRRNGIRAGGTLVRRPALSFSPKWTSSDPVARGFGLVTRLAVFLVLKDHLCIAFPAPLPAQRLQ
jgi:hypothetical protein